MLSLEYCEIDKSAVLDEPSVIFNLYIEKEDTKTITLFKESNDLLSSSDKYEINKGFTLYVKIEEIMKYQYLFDIDDPNENSDYSAKDLYLNVSTKLDMLFTNEISPNEWEPILKLTNTIIDFVANEEFNLLNIIKNTPKNYCTHTHSINVSIYSLCLGRFLGMNAKQLQALGIASLLHDIGKQGIDNKLLYKEGSLTDDEFRIVKMHSVMGYNLCHKLGIHDRSILDGIRYHHEKLDGSGYPYGLKGDAIPVNARIIGICDIFDALTSKRPYKDALSKYEAFKFMKQKMINHIDMRILNNMILFFQKIAKSYG